MSQTILTLRIAIGGVLTDASSATLESPDTVSPAFGVKRTDTNAILVASGTAFTRVDVGLYQYPITDPGPGITYSYWRKYVVNGQPNYDNKFATSASAVACYHTVTTARALAATVPGLAAVNAASDGDLQLWLQDGTSEIDTALPYQGRKYDLATPQTLEFPRILHASYMHTTSGEACLAPSGIAGSPADVADWDPVNNVAIVPRNVLLANLYQADFIGGGRNPMIDLIHAGLRSQSNTGMSEAYDAKAAGADTGLCRKAWQLMRKYRLTSGRIL